MSGSTGTSKRQVYNIAIDETQRLALLDALKKSSSHELWGDGELSEWVDMLTNLPKEEADNPGVLHGFCY